MSYKYLKNSFLKIGIKHKSYLLRISPSIKAGQSGSLESYFKSTTMPTYFSHKGPPQAANKQRTIGSPTARIRTQYRTQNPFVIASYNTSQAPIQQLHPFLQLLNAFICANLADDQIRIPEICRVVLISRSQMHNRIKTLTGYSASIYVRSVRLREARKMLVQTELSVSEVAYACGFKDPSYFTRVFRGWYGVVPSRVREGVKLHYFHKF